MSNLWTLLQEELRRLTPQLRGWTQRLSAASDGEAVAQWQRRLASFRGAVAVLGSAPLLALVGWLQEAWNRPAERRQRASQVERVIGMLEELSGLETTAVEARLAILNKEIEALEGAASAPAEVEDSVDPRLRALFATEVEDRSAAMTRVLLLLEKQPERLELIAPIMRAAHSVKGAARAVRNDAMVALAHALEDRFSLVQKKAIPVAEDLIDVALHAVDQMRVLGRDSGATALAAANELIAALQRAGSAVASAGEAPPDLAAVTGSAPARADGPVSNYIDAQDTDPILRVRASHIGRLIALAGTGMVESRRLKPFAERQQQLRRQVAELARLLDDLHHRLGAPAADSVIGSALVALRHQLNATRVDLNDWTEGFGDYTRETMDLTERLYHTASQTRLRPFGDIAISYPRIVRDLARQLGKRAHADVIGEKLAVDREVLERLDPPLTHLLRNALDHGIESIEQRRAAGKPEEGRVSITATYRAGMLALEVADDGAGIDFELVRRKLVAMGRADAASAAALDEEALKEFLFATGFTTREQVSEVSGRGVGLDVVRQILKQLDGSVSISSKLGQGTTFHLQVPISRAVMRALVVRVAGDAYAFPLLRIERVLRASTSEMFSRGSLQYLAHDGRNIGLIPLAEHLGLGRSRLIAGRLDVVVVAIEGRAIGFAIEEVVGEYDLATRPLDPRLGRVADVAALAVLPDSSPVVVLDVDDLMRGALESERAQIGEGSATETGKARAARILVVDDSISVRELERQMLAAAGYDVDVAVDGMDAWSRLRENSFDLVVTDVDMPRMDGIELTRSIKQDPKLRALPVVIVSYRDRAEDRNRGLEVRADAYLTKGDFQEDRFIEIVHGLIGGPQEVSI